jgi:signal transduction histidine kinase
VPVLDALGTPYAICGVAADITERKRLAEVVRQWAEDLRQKGQRRDVSLAMLAHELRNPLAPIRNAAQREALEEMPPGRRGQRTARSAGGWTNLILSW